MHVYFGVGVLVITITLFIKSSEQKPLDTVETNQTTCDAECICRPTPTENLVQYIVGYGSFIKVSSIQATDPDAGESIPVIIDGYQRVWNAQGHNVGFGTTYLGVEKSENASFNGVVFPLPPTEANKNSSSLIRSYDLREEWYCRHRLPMDKIKMLDGHSPPPGEYWIYVNKPEYTIRPNKEYPIVQSYVDIFLAGCLEIEENFNLPGYTKACVKSTIGWNKYWVNDRLFPRRARMYQPRAVQIDTILSQEVPAAFNEIRIEG